MKLFYGVIKYDRLDLALILSKLKQLDTIELELEILEKLKLLKVDDYSLLMKKEESNGCTLFNGIQDNIACIYEAILETK